MNNPGVYTLTALQIGAPVSALVEATENLGGMNAATLEADFQYGSGGATCSAIVVTSLDGGVRWLHVARFDFTLASVVKTANLSGLSPKGVAANADLASEGVNDGLLGDRLAVKLISTGSYVNTVLSLRAAVR
jgi:hypothetical protein